MKRKTGKTGVKRRTARAPVEAVTFAPAEAREGDRLLVRSTRPFRGPAIPEVTVGGVPLLAPVLRDPFTIVGEIAADSPGRKRIVVGKGKAALSPRGTFLHGGKRASPAAAGGRRRAFAWRSIQDYGFELLPDGQRERAHDSFDFPFSATELLNTTSPASVWWMQGANLSHDGRMATAAGPPLSDAWRFVSSHPNTFDFAEPVLSGDTLLLAPATSTSQGEVLLALDAATGVRRWTWQVDAPAKERIQSPPVCVGNRFYVVKLIDGVPAERQTVLICADVANGATRWQMPLPSANWNSFARLAAASGRVHVVSYDGDEASLSTFDALTGSLVWQRLNEIPIFEQIGLNESIAVTAGSVITGSSRGLRSFDAATGEPQHSWRVDFDCSYSPIVVSGGGPRTLVIAGDNAGRICAFDAVSHEPVWRFAGVADSQWVWPRMACDLRRLYLMQPRFMVALDLANGEPLTRSPDLGQWNLGAPSVGGKSVFVFARQALGDPTLANRLVCLNRGDISTVLELFAVGGATNLVRPVIDGARLYLNLSQDEATSSSQNVIRAISLR